MKIDLNADVGESFGVYTIGEDSALIPLITSANVACGFHAGDPGVMRATVALARAHGVAVGAHPSFPDLVGFGRRDMNASPRDIENMVAYQIGALAGLAAAEGVRLQHVKAHGALYNMAARDRVVADAVARATVMVDRTLVLLGLPDSQLTAAGRAAGLRTASEGFADRAYQADGSLVPRGQPGAVIENADAVVTRAVTMARDRTVVAMTGARVALDVETICVHGDTPGAAVLAGRIRDALQRAGIGIQALAAIQSP